jgi:hypothetical protein
LENSNNILTATILENYDEILSIKDVNTGIIKWIYKTQIKYGPAKKLPEDLEETF